MRDNRLWDRDAVLLSRVAAEAAAEVQDAVVDYAVYMGRSGLVVRLRLQARDLAPSAIGHDQIRSLAFGAAADDIAWGRPPLATWGPFAPGATGASGHERAALRAALPQADNEVASKGEQVAKDIERHLLSKQDAFDAIAGLAVALGECAEIQATLWDDPRLAATQDIRLVMQASIAPLQRRLDALGPPPMPAPSPRPESSPTETVVSGWRRFFTACR